MKSSTAKVLSLLVTMFVGFLGGTAFSAEIAPIPPGTIGIYSVSGEVVSTKPLCPFGAKCVTDGTIVELAFKSQGCVDQLLPLTYTRINNFTVLVHAQVLATEQSQRVRCAKQQVFKTSLQLPLMFKSLIIKFLGTDEFITVK